LLSSDPIISSSGDIIDLLMMLSLSTPITASQHNNIQSNNLLSPSHFKHIQSIIALATKLFPKSGVISFQRFISVVQESFKAASTEYGQREAIAWGNSSGTFQWSKGESTDYGAKYPGSQQQC